MPKPVKYNNGKGGWKNQYSEHDFRAGGDTRRVSFKPHNKNFKKNNKDWGETIRAHLEEEDIDMSMGSGAGISGRVFHHNNKKPRGGKGGQRPGSPAPKKFFDGPINWYKVSLPHGNRYKKEFILNALQQNVSPLPFWPITWKIQGPSVIFFVDDKNVAERLSELNRTLQLPDGFKLIIKVSFGFPSVEINQEISEKIKITMANRYNAATKALDLTKFHADPNLQDVFVALFKPVVFLKVIDVIAENIPDVEAINLADNRITSLSFLKKLHTKLPNLKILHMANNKLSNIVSLDPLIGLPLVELVLSGNPLCGKYKDEEAYIGEVRKRFPKVMRLDNTDLPPPISFDIVEEVVLPPSQQTYLCNQQGEAIVRQFLELYFQVFDSGNRQPLLQAYHESALFSLTAAYPYGQKDKSSSWLNWYHPENRNILRLSDPERRNKLLKQGQVSIVSFLNEMPSTKHNIHSFTVDLVLFEPQMLTLVVTGIFREYGSGHKTPPARYFFKTLVIVPAGSGFCIINETLHITNATEEQLKVMLPLPPTVTVTPPPEPSSSVTSPLQQQQQQQTIPVQPDDATKQQMVQALSQQTGMNLEWSTKCLTETQWNFSLATSVFADLNSQGSIPAEAFVQ